MDLSDYLQNEAKKRHVKKSDIAFRTGISESYIYKIFTGTKHTKQRDYVIAICRAMNMNVVETQIALTLNGMDVLNPKKQDPMVPDVYGDGYADGLPVYDMWDCPACGTSYEIEGEQHEYCPHCGQRINWEGYKEECESM